MTPRGGRDDIDPAMLGDSLRKLTPQKRIEMSARIIDGKAIASELRGRVPSKLRGCGARTE